MKSIHALLFVVSAFAAPVSVASAGHWSPLHAAACEYRDAVDHFDRAVHAARFIDPCDLRLVHGLQDAACELHSVTRYPERVDQILFQWRQVQSLQRRVEAAIFGRACDPRHVELMACWKRVTCAYAELAEQIECTCHQHPVQRPPLGVSDGITFGLPQVIASQVAVPSANPYAAPRATMPRTPYPNTPFPSLFAPHPSPVNNFIRPQFQSTAPLAPQSEEIRYFGQRHLGQPQQESLRPSVDAPFGGRDLRSAMIGAMLSRLAH